MASLILYGLPLSQACRAVLWALVQKREPFRLEPVVPGSAEKGGSRHPDFLTMNPGGTIPAIEEPESGFVLGESAAILCYLARTRGWTDLYPEDAGKLIGEKKKTPKAKWIGLAAAAITIILLVIVWQLYNKKPSVTREEASGRRPATCRR